MKKIIEAAIYALIFILPWQTRWIFAGEKINGAASEYLTYSLYASDILLVLIILLSISYILLIHKSNVAELIKKQFLKNRFFIGVTVFMLLAVSSIASANDKSLSLFYVYRIFSAMALGSLVVLFVDSFKVAISYILSLIIPSLLALWQFIFQTSFENKWLGLAKHPAEMGGTSVIEVFSTLSGRWLRAYGSFDHPNILGGALTFGILLMLILQLDKKNKANGFLLYLFYFCNVIFSAALFVSFSRSAWLGLIFGLVIIIGTNLIKKNNKNFRVITPSLAVIAVVFFIMIMNYRGLLQTRIQGNSRLENLSIDQRAFYLKQADKIINENPIFGVGAGNYIRTVATNYPGQQAWSYQPVHNIFLLIWAEIGIFGLIAFVLLLANAVLMMYGKYYLALLAAIAPITLADHWLWDIHFGTMFFAVVFALIVSFSKNEKPGLIKR